MGVDCQSGEQSYRCVDIVHVCVYILVYILCMHVCVCIGIGLDMYCMYVSLYVYACILMYACVYLYLCVSLSLCMLIHIYIYGVYVFVWKSKPSLVRAVLSLSLLSSVSLLSHLFDVVTQ